jgi:hypothetical protein
MNALLRKEWKLMRRDRAFIWSGLGFLVLATAAHIHGILAVKRIEADQEIQLRATRESHDLYLQEAKAGKMKFGSLLYKARIPFAFDLPAGASLGLTALEGGPRSLDLSLKAFIPQSFTPTYLNPIRPASGVLDYWGVLSFYLPLWVLGLCFNFHSKEDELGTLRQLEAEGMSTVQLLLPKAILVFILTAGTAGFFTLLAGFTSRPTLDFTTISAAIGVQTLYLSLWIALGTGIAALKLSTSRSALLALASWIGINWLFPALWTLRSNPTFHERNVRLLSAHRSTLNQYWDQPKASPLAAFSSPPSWVRMALEKTDEAFSWGWYYSMHEATDERYRNDFEKTRNESIQEKSRLMRSSGNGLFEFVLDGLVGLGPDHQLNQMEKARALRGRIQNAWIPLMIPDQEIEVGEIRRVLGRNPAP